VKYLLASLVALFLVLGNSVSAHAQDEVTIVAPMPFRAALDKLIPGFENKTGYKVKVTNGTSLGTRDQAARGDAFDVFVVQPPYQEALASGNIVGDSATALARFVVAVCIRKGAPMPDISTAEAVKRMLLAAKSVTYQDPAAGTAGARVSEMFQKLGIADQMKPKSTITPNSGPAQASVADGDIDLCLAYLSDLRNPGIDAVGPLSREISTPNDMVGLLSSHAKDPVASKALLSYLSAPEAAAIYKAAGMEPVH
jgi:molybdate transport system substrate-binding protein